VTSSGVVRSIVLGTGSELPPEVLANAAFREIVDTSDSWIRSRTGIKQRRILEAGKGNADMAYAAAARALEDAGLAASDLDAIIVGTVTPDYIFPSSACLLENMLGAKGAIAFDVSAACTGFLNALAVGDSFVRSGTARRVLVVGSDVLSRMVNWEDRSTCVLFGDAAGAVVLGAGNGDGRGILATRLKSDGAFAKSLYVPAGGSKRPATCETIRNKENMLCMDGKEVFRSAVPALVEISREAIQAAGLAISDIALVVPHQGNHRIVSAVAGKLGVPIEKVVVNIDRYGNTSAASVPVGLDEARREGRIRAGDAVLLCAFGAGFTWGASVIRF
jgi:3-oxoacyl-[acyl-carrier-protein] synthase-3